MKTIHFLLLFIMLCSGYFLIDALWPKEIVPLDQETPVDQVLTDSATIHISSSSISASAHSVTQNGRKLTSTEIAVKSDWMRRTGRSSEDREAYKNYSDAQLNELVVQGDINAMYELGDRKLVSEGTQAAIPFAHKEIVYGSLKGISTMAIYLQPDLSSSLPVDELKRQLMESSAYYDFYGMRGDPYNAKLFKETQIKSFETAYKIDQVFNEDDEVWIANRAKELYDYYQAERNKLGLGDFDNEVPKEVKTFFGE